MDEEDIEIDEDEGVHVDQRLMPSEFLYLLTNASPRIAKLQKLCIKRSDSEMRFLGEFMDGRDRRTDLESIYHYNIPFNFKRHNPRNQLLEQHALEAKDTRIVIDDMRTLFKKEHRAAGSAST